MRSDDATPHVAIVGGGFSGTVTAVHLADAGARVTLIERSGRFGEGVAYGTREPAHLLNVRASNMSALADRPDHFEAWLGDGQGASFAGRMKYGAYLQDLLAKIGGPVERVEDEAVGVESGSVALRSGRVVEADAVVIAAGNILPEPWRAFAKAAVPYVNEPWSRGGQDAIAELARQTGELLVLGTGLTMIDAMLSLTAHGFEGRVLALSRRGLLPRPHAAGGGAAPALPVARRPMDLLRWVRARSADGDWRSVVDALRPGTVDIWQSWTDPERSRFLRHLRPWWDVHRHRVAPEIAGQVERWTTEGRLRARAGRVFVGEDGGLRVLVRGASNAEPIEIAGIVNCTGPQGDLRTSRDPLIRALLVSGAARTDAFGLGLDVDADCRIVDRTGQVPHGFYAVGPMTRGRFWEMTAVPDIRRQASDLAACIMRDLTAARPALRAAS